MVVSLLVPRTPALVSERSGFRCTQVSATLWRVTRTNGKIAGYIEVADATAINADVRRAAESSGQFTVKRMNRDHRTFTTLGTFATMEEAVEGLRLWR